MGREVRIVPKDWEHPHNHLGKPEPLHDGSFKEMMAEYRYDRDLWKYGYRRPWLQGFIVLHGEDCTYIKWAGSEPMEEDYMPDFPRETCTHLQMYETCSEGTPISPIMETPEELARWLADNGASAFGGMTATYEQWLATCKGGYAPSALYSQETGFISGVEAMANTKEDS